MSTAYQSSCAIKASDSSLWCWGASANGQLGNGTTTPDVAAPVQIGGATWASLAGGGYRRTCGLRVNGTIWCWGYGTYGALGNGGAADSSTPAQESTGATDWTRLTNTAYGACATRGGNGALYCWGRNNTGQHGVGNTGDLSSPAVSGAATDWTAVAAGAQHVCGIRPADRALWCQGDNASLQLGFNLYTNAVAPTRLDSGASSWTGGSSGYNTGCGVRADGTLWCWGANSSGEAGVGDTAVRLAPTQVAGSGWASVSVGLTTSCALTAAGAMYCAGSNANGAFGAVSADSSTFVAGAPGTWKQVSVADNHACGVTTAGALRCWGANSNGQYGNGGTGGGTTPTAPSAVAGVTTWRSVVAGGATTCAQADTGSEAGSLYCWGQNNTGQVGTGSTATPQTAPVKIGSGAWLSFTMGFGHACAVRSADRTLWCWGSNNYGQSGNGAAAGSPANVTSPTQSGTGTDWDSVAAGYLHECARKTDHSVWCWGEDANGALGDRGVHASTSPQLVPFMAASALFGHGRGRGMLAAG